ncbi:ATP-binding protein [Novosphingobium sp. SL115]|uniref:sensor histidine kinase n=1 Tax=Novosphingobium sp. SL115 TaxID=2995150 RepID=UPI0022731D18|nr:sensor histidine kinase [Novosphingobium sp. SL115]MCY1672030.1 ATP-binding protein [Novosphingobium sp. SL115]
MNSLRFKLWMALAFVLVTIAVPGVIARHALKVVQAQHARSEASAQSLSSYQRLAVLGYTLIQERYIDPVAFDRDRTLYVDGVRSHITNAERYINAEIRLISETSLQRSSRAQFIEAELRERDQVRKIGASMERAIRGEADSSWEKMVLDLIKLEEREGKELRRSSIETVKGVTDTLTLTLSIATIFGLMAVAWGQRQIIRPLGNLWAGTRAMAEGRYDERVPIKGTTEFRTISSSFNIMAEKVGNAAKAMRRNNEELERAVASRTTELAATNRSLERANRLRQQFLADASHELRTPLSIMRSEAEITLRDPGADRTNMRTSLERIVRLSALMGELIDDMLQIARAEEPMLQTSITPIDVVQAVRNSVGDFLRVIEADGGSIAIIEAPDSLIIEGDEAKLQQVIRIVVDNAVCYSSQEPVVEVAIREEQGDAVIQIADKGDGIPAEDIPHMFKRFRRGSRKMGSGQGLGLSIARSISEALGGSIGLESKLHEGTTVSIRLPLLPGQMDRAGTKS